MIQISVVAIGGAHRNHPVEAVWRLTPSDHWREVHHLYDRDGDYGADPGEWLWAEEVEDEDDWDGYFTPTQWSCICEPPPNGWSYLFEFSDGTTGVSRIEDVEPALRALGYEVDRRGD